MVIRYKRTTPFEEQCTFMLDFGDEIVRCDGLAEYGIYFGNDEKMLAIYSLCIYHTAYKESLWKAGIEK